MHQKRTLVNTHIEKTAGTSLLKFFEEIVGKNTIAFYDPTTDSVIRVSDLGISPSNDLIDKLQLKSYAFWPFVKQAYFTMRSNKRYTQSIPENVAIVHGHFAANRFDTILPDAIRTVVIRDPLKRMHSQYDHWKRAKGRNQWRVIVPYDPNMMFEQFAMLPAMQNYQTQALAGKELTSFDIVGVTERLDAFTTALYTVLVKEGYINSTIALKKVEKLNTHRKNHQVKSSAFEETFRKFHAKDYELYKKALTLAP